MISRKVGKWKETEEKYWCNPSVSTAHAHVLHVIVCYEFKIYRIYYCKTASFDSLFRKCTSFLLENWNTVMDSPLLKNQYHVFQP